PACPRAGSRTALPSTPAPGRGPNDVPDVDVGPDPGGEPRRLTPSRGPAAGPAFSPDGSLVAYLGHDDPPGVGRDAFAGVWVVPVDGGAAGYPPRRGRAPRPPAPRPGGAARARLRFRPARSG